jgi:hypothetical protein
VFGDGSKSVHDTPHGEVWKQPKENICEWMDEHGRYHKQSELHEKYPALCVSLNVDFAKHAKKLSAQHFVTRCAQRIALHFAQETCFCDWVVGIQRDVWFVWPKLFSVMCHVHVAIAVGIRKGWVAKQPSTDKIIYRAIAKEQAMYRFVHQCQALCVRTAHENKRNDVGDGVM